MHGCLYGKTEVRLDSAVHGLFLITYEKPVLYAVTAHKRCITGPELTPGTCLRKLLISRQNFPVSFLKGCQPWPGGARTQRCNVPVTTWDRHRSETRFSPHEPVSSRAGFYFSVHLRTRTLEAFTIESLHAALHVKVHGPAHPEAVVLLHGGPGVPDYLDEVAAHLGRRFRAVTFDQRGVGQSRALDGSYALDRYLDDINAIAGHLGLRTFHLLGHSWGGLLAQLYARQYAPRLSSLFLSSPVPGPGRQWAAMIAEESVFIARRFAVPDLLRISSGWVRGELGGSEAGWQQFYGTVWKYYFFDPAAAPPLDPALRAGISGKAAAGTVRAILKTSARVLDGLADTLQVPVGVLYAERDFLQRTRRPVYKRFPAARCYEIPGAGHVAWADNAAAFHAALAAFYGQIKTA